MLSEIEVDTSMEAYFSELLAEAVALRGGQLDSALHDYLVGVLVSFASLSAGGGSLPLLLGPTSVPANDQSAGPVVGSGEANPPSSATSAADAFLDYRSLGDEALFLTGFFGPWTQARDDLGVSVQTIGREAYRAAVAVADSKVRRQFSEALACVCDVVDDFEQYANILGDVRENTVLAAGDDRAAMLARWQQQPSAVLGQRMAQLGIFPGRSDFRS